MAGARATIVGALPRKSRTPAPPKRPVQAPKLRTEPRDPQRNRKIVLAVAGSALVIAAGVLGFLLLGGQGDGSAATSVAAKFRATEGEFRTLPAAENFRHKGKKLPYRHLPTGELPKGFRYNSTPPTSGIHTDATVIWGIYDQSVPLASTVHNLEHGGVVIRYGPDVPQSEVDKIGEFYVEDANGLVVAPMPGLKDRIALTAWTFDLDRQTDRTYDGEGQLATAKRFDEEAFSAFVDSFRGKGPERFPVSDLQPGGG